MLRVLLVAVFLVLPVAAMPVAAQTIEFRSVASNAAVLYDGPSTDAHPLYVVSKGYPLEVIVNLEAWAKVRDATGAFSWIEKQDLTNQRTVLVTSQTANVYAQPQKTSQLEFVAGKNVVLQLMQVVPGGWVQVRLANGPEGYVRIGLIWGV